MNALWEATGISQSGKSTVTGFTAETDSEGHITAHYVYLYGKPIAKIEMQKNIEATHQLWKTITSLGGLIKPTEIDASDTQAKIYAIHTDHLCTPQAVTDEAQQIVWQADTSPFGMASINYAAILKINEKAKAFEIKSAHVQSHCSPAFPTYGFDKLPNNCQVAQPKKKSSIPRKHSKERT